MRFISTHMLAAIPIALVNLCAHAQSNVTISGTLDTYVGSVQSAGGQKVTGVFNGGMTTSQIAFKGNEDLGGGLSAGFTLASYLQLNSGTPGRFTGDPFFSQAANVSLSGGFGQVFVGRGQAPNYLPTILFNPFGDSFAFSPLILHTQIPLYGAKGQYWTPSVPSDAGWNNRVLYIAPTVAGLTAAGFYQFGQVAGASGKRNVGMNLMYNNGPFAATAFYESDDVTNPGNSALFTTGDRKTDWMTGASWDFQVAKTFITYGKSNSNLLAAKQSTWSLGISAPFGRGKVLADTAYTEVTPSGVTRRTTTVGYDFTMSKRTDAYVNVMRDQITARNNGNTWGIGLRHRF